MSITRPCISSELYQPSLIGSFSFIAYTVFLCVVPALLARSILIMSMPMFLTISLITPLVWLTAQGMLLLAWVGHEGFHLSLHRNKLLSALIGILFSSALPTYFEVGAAISHWNHHRYTNQSSDPDCKIFRPFQSFWQRLFFARVVANITYLSNTLKMAFSQPLDYTYKFHFKDQEVVFLAWVNIIFSIVWMVLYVSITIQDPQTGIFTIILPTVILFLLSSLQPYLEHGGTSVGIGNDANSHISMLFTLLYFGNNYHLEHHLYPGVPCYRLPLVHQMLRDQGFYHQEADDRIKSGYIEAYKQAVLSPYPTTDWKDSSFNPMASLDNSINSAS
jgi:beta-carotene hydroxylase